MPTEQVRARLAGYSSPGRAFRKEQGNGLARESPVQSTGVVILADLLECDGGFQYRRDLLGCEVSESEEVRGRSGEVGCFPIRYAGGVTAGGDGEGVGGSYEGAKGCGAEKRGGHRRRGGYHVGESYQHFSEWTSKVESESFSTSR